MSEPSEKAKAMVHNVYHSATNAGGTAKCTALLCYIARLESIEAAAHAVADAQAGTMASASPTGMALRRALAVLP